MTLDLLAIGLTTLDIVGRPIGAVPEGEGTRLIEGIEVVPAGTAGGMAMVAATLGLRTGVATLVGDDRKGRILRAELAAAGIDLALVETRADTPTSATILAIAEDGRRPNFHALGAAMLVEPTAAMHDGARAARFVHYGAIGGPRMDGGGGAALLADARAAGATVTCDLISPGPGASAELDRVLPHVDWFLPSAVEARALSGHDDLAVAAASFLSRGARGCVVKNGANGSVLVLPDGSVERVPARAIAVVDTTSCGDSFCAGFVAALSRGADPLAAVRFATATASLVAQGLGTLGLLTGTPQVEELLSRG